MRVATAVVCLLCCFVGTFAAVRLTDDNWEEQLAAHMEPWFIRFCTPSNPDCKKMDDAFASFTFEGGRTADVDCNRYPDPCLDFHIKKKYPSIVLMDGESRKKYDGAEHTAEAWQAWIKAGLHGDVIPLTTDNYESVRSGEWMVEYYTPWCGHCKHLAPTYKELATAALGNFKVAKVNCEAMQAVCALEDIKGYPTVKFYRDGVAHEMRERTVAELLQAVEKIRTPPAPSTEEAAASADTEEEEAEEKDEL